MNQREVFLNYQVKLIDQVLGFTFTGASLFEKEEFYLKHKEALYDVMQKVLADMYTAVKMKVFRFGDGISNTDWMAATTKESALQTYESAFGPLGKEIEIKEVNIFEEFMLLEPKDVPASDLHLFKPSEQYNHLLEVPFVYGIDYVIQDGGTFPCIIDSIE